MKVLVLDNYDSFTWNLVHLFEELGAEVLVHRNDAITVDEAEELAPDRLVISPGPGRPADAGVSVELIRRLGPRTPTLGVCLGHQAIVEAFGGEVGQAKALLHGKASVVTHDGKGVYAGLPEELEAGRYHSLAATPNARGARRHGTHRGRRGHGREASAAPDRGRPVPPGERADTARAGDGPQLPALAVARHLALRQREHLVEELPQPVVGQRAGIRGDEPVEELSLAVGIDEGGSQLLLVPLEDCNELEPRVDGVEDRAVDSGDLVAQALDGRVGAGIGHVSPWAG